MKRIVSLLVIIFAVLAITACGSSTPAATPTASSAVMTASANGTVVNVTLADNTIKSSLTTFQAGVPYTFVIQNTGNHGHNFNISTPVTVAGSLDTALSSALLSVRQDKLAGGANVTVEYTFPASAIGKPLEFSCLIKRHYEDGMKLPITVTK